MSACCKRLRVRAIPDVVRADKLRRQNTMQTVIAALAELNWFLHGGKMEILRYVQSWFVDCIWTDGIILILI